MYQQQPVPLPVVVAHASATPPRPPRLAVRAPPLTRLGVYTVRNHPHQPAQRPPVPLRVYGQENGKWNHPNARDPNVVEVVDGARDTVAGREWQENGWGGIKMAGKPGRSGRKKGSGMSAAEHQLPGTYRRSRHGSLDGAPRIRPVLAAVPKATPAPPSLGQPLKFLDADDAPDELTPEGKAFWLTLVVTRPTEKIFGQLVACYVEAWQSWRRATLEIQKIGDLMRQGNRAVPNPYIALRSNAERTMTECARFLNWTPAVAKADQHPDAAPTKLDLFIAERRRR
jgi:phage terminase small subunit